MDVTRIKVAGWMGVLFFGAALAVQAFASTGAGATVSSPSNVYGIPYYNQHNPLKAVFEVPNNPKKWPAVPLVITHNLVSLIGHRVPFKVVLVAPGPTIHFFMKKYNPNGYQALKRLHELGVKMVACHAALVAFHVPQKDLFPFVGVAYPSGVIGIIKLESEGYAYYTWP